MVLAIALGLFVAGCADDPTDPIVTGEIPRTTSTDDGGSGLDASATVAALRANAENFEYTVGTPGGSWTFATISEPLTFNREVASDAGSVDALSYVFEGLTQTSWLDDTIEPRLASAWEVSDDLLRWVFTLRDDVRWHDGTPFTAADVDFTFNRIIYNDDFRAASRSTFEFHYLDPETGQWLDSPMEVAALDDHTVEFVLPTPYAPFLRALGTSIYPKHILEPHVDDGTFPSVWDIETDPAEIIGTGPFSIAEYTPGVRLVFQRNPDYWLTDQAGNRLPYLDEVVQVVVEDSEAGLALFQAGQVDSRGLTGEDYTLLEPLQEAGNFTIHRRGPGFGTRFVGFNLNPGVNPDSGEPFVSPTARTWFGEVDFRRAVSHAIDRARIIQDVQFGLGYPQWSSISPATGDFHNPDVRQYPYDLAGANRLLDGLGWRDSDGDGVREDTDGNPIEFTLITTSSGVTLDRIAHIVVEGMVDIGLDASVEFIEFGDLVNRLSNSYDWESVMIGFTGGPDPYAGITLWHSSEPLHLWYPNQESPATAWEAEIDDLYVKASRELDHETRVGYYHRAQEIAAEQVPLIYTTLSERLSALRNVFGNVTPTLYGLTDIRYAYRTDLG